MLFFVKGADSVVAPMCDFTDWLDEECGNMAREGLRTLVYAKRSAECRMYLENSDSKQTNTILTNQNRDEKQNLGNK